MALYWSKNDVPAMKRLTPAQRDAAERSVQWRVFAQWQFWFPTALYMTGVFVYAFEVPYGYPYKKLLLLVAAAPFAKVLHLIYNHYLQVHLEGYMPPCDPSKQP